MLFNSSLPNNPEDREDFPALLVEPWRVSDLLKEETAKKRYYLFRFVSFVRLAFLLLGFVVFSFHGDLAVANLISAGTYLLLLVSLYIHALWNRKDIIIHSFLIGMFEVFFVSYFFMISDEQLELSFIFFSILLSAVLLPASKLVIVVIFAYIVVTLWWLDVSGQLSDLFFTNSLAVNWQILVSYATSRKGQEILVLSLGFLLVAFLVNRLAIWSFTNEVRANFRHKQMRQVLAYNRAIVEHLKTGVVTLNTDGKIISINRRAIDLLNLKTDRPITELNELSSQLSKRYKNWLAEGVEVTNSYQHNVNAEEVVISFSRFTNSQPLVMMSIDSVNVSAQQAREAKLSALGRLTAGIAHEIRNPLAAISSAAQLLNEEAVSPRQNQLTELVLNNIQRTDKIIKDVLGLFTDAQPTRERLDVEGLLSAFVREFSAAHSEYKFSLNTVNLLNQTSYLMFDVEQFNQVLWNVCHNALKYSNNPSLIITLIYRLSADNRMIYIDMIDNGIGVPEAKQNYLFEPFYTGGSTGAGLGLYLVRQLCGANNANIAYIPLEERDAAMSEHGEGACFRLSTQAYFAKKNKPTLRDGR